MKTFILLAGVSLSLVAGEIAGDYISTIVEKGSKTTSSYMETTFSKDGKLYIMSMPVGSWKEDKANHTLTINSLFGSGKPELNKIIKNDNKELVLKSGQDIVHYMKIDKDKALQNNKKAPFLGSWQIKSNPSVSESFTLKLPNNFSYIKDDKKENTTKKINGSWYYFPDKNTLIISSFDNTIHGKNTIKQLSKDMIVLENSNKKITATKK